MATDPTPNADDDEDSEDAGLTPEEVYQFFKERSVPDLIDLADRAVASIRACTTRAEAEKAIVQIAPFFLDCTFPRLPDATKETLRNILDVAESQFGSLAEVLGLEKPENDGDDSNSAAPDAQAPTVNLTDVAAQLAKFGEADRLPDDPAIIGQLALAACQITPECFATLDPAQKGSLQRLVTRIEELHGPVEALAARARAHGQPQG